MDIQYALSNIFLLIIITKYKCKMHFTRTYLTAFHTIAFISWIATALIIASTRHVDALGVGMTPIHHVARYWTQACARLYTLHSKRR